MTLGICEVAVLGAGMVGVSVARALCERGVDTVLIDRKSAGQETSYGNAGVINLGSIVPTNNPGLIPALPFYITNRSPAFRYSPKYLGGNLGWFLSFLSHATQKSTARRAIALNSLIVRSTELHDQWLREENKESLLRRKGWLKLFRTVKAFRKAKLEFQILANNGVKFKELGTADLLLLEPVLKPIFEMGVLIPDTRCSVDPSAIVTTYFDKYIGIGGSFQKFEVQNYSRASNCWELIGTTGEVVRAKKVVVALGPWSTDFLMHLGIRLPLVYERGGHREFLTPPGTQQLTRAIHDVEGAYVASPLLGRLRVTCGVEINHRDSRNSPVQLDLAESACQDAMKLHPKRIGSDWFGSRPTLPDCLPALGPTSIPGIWLATGHQHIGFSTGPASGELLAQLITGERANDQTDAFDPRRFKHC